MLRIITAALMTCLAAAAARGDDIPGLRFEIQLATPSPFVVGEPILIRMTLVNGGPAPVDAFLPHLQNEVAAALVIRKADGAQLPYAAELVDPWLPQSVRLEPGRSQSITEDAGRWYALHKPGRYTLRAVTPKSILDGGRPLPKLTSNEIAFEVVEPMGKIDMRLDSVRVEPGLAAKRPVTWRLFSNPTGKGPVLFSCLMGGSAPQGMTFAAIGQVSPDGPVVARLDAACNLHLLRPIDAQRNLYAHDRVTLFFPDLLPHGGPFTRAEVAHLGLYAAPAGATPALTDALAVQGATRIDEKPAAPDAR